jgi:hypothetical protein
VGASTSFHRDNASRLFCKERKNLGAGQSLSESNASVSVSAMRMEYALCQIDADDGDVVHDVPPPDRSLFRAANLPHLSVGGRGIHSINF